MKRSFPATETAFEQSSVAAVIVNYRTPELTARCLEALRTELESLPKLRATIVDGGSGDGSAENLRKLVAQEEYCDWVTFLPLEANGGFGWACNQAILTMSRKQDTVDFIYLLNPDAEVKQGSLALLVSDMVDHPRCGAVGSQLLDTEGGLAASAFRFPSAARELTAAAGSQKLGKILGIAPIVIQAAESLEADWVTGASVLLRSEALREVGLFDDGFFLYFDEVELMHRLRGKGWTVRHVARSHVVHVEGAATGLGAAAARAYPRYWYDSRRRYFALTGGRAAVVRANLAWILGRLMALPKRLLGRPTHSRALLSILLASFWPSQGDLTPSAPRWGDPPGKPPKWMKQP